MQRWLLIGILALAAVPLAAAEENGLKAIFDGKTLDGWDGDPRLWHVEDGCITGQTTAENPTKHNTYLIWRGGRPADFEMLFEFKCCNAVGNSGLQYRSREEPEKWGRWIIGGYQADIDAGNKYTGIFYEERGRGILALRGQCVVIGPDHKPKIKETFGDAAELAKVIKANDWNSYRVVAEGNHMRHWINDKLMVDVVDEDPEQRRGEGLLAFQLHAGPPMKVQFRNIRLKELSPAAKPQPTAAGKKKKIVFIAGKPSHRYAEHEHCAGCLLLADCLKKFMPNDLETIIYRDGWPGRGERSTLEDADALVIITDGSKSHPMLKHVAEVEKLMARGVGLACIHYAVAMPKGPDGDKLKQWLGGYYEPYWSVNPFWTAEFKQFPDHPVARGLKPFAIEDEWYYNMRFLDDMSDVTPILTATPPDSTREGPDGPSSGNATVRARKGMAEHLAWVRQRPDGGRGFGFTGGHWHWNWGNDDFRKVVLNGIAWVAKIEIPPDGIPSPTPAMWELQNCQDKPEPEGFDRGKVQKLLDSWKR
jgi:type 1 glutamine amidotransferase